MMKVVAAAILGIVVAGLSPAGGGEPTRPDAGDQSLDAALIGLEKESWVAWKGHDGKFFASFLSDDHVELGFGGPAGKAAVVSMVASPACSVQSYSVDRFTVTKFDSNTALVTYRADQTTTCNGAPVPSPVWVSSLYLKRGGRWLNALYQQTPIPKK